MRYINKYFLIICCIATSVAVLSFFIFGGMMNNSPKHIKNLIIDVDYSGFWKVEFQDCNGFYAFDSMGIASGKIPIQSPRSDLWIGEVTTYKIDGTRNLLMTRLLLEDGSIYQQSATDSPYGETKVSFKFKYDPTIDEYCPVVNL